MASLRPRRTRVTRALRRPEAARGRALRRRARERERDHAAARRGGIPPGPPPSRPPRLAAVPEGDAIHRTAERLRVLEGEGGRADSPHPRAALLRIAERIDGHRLERVEAVGKNLLLTFEDGIVVRSHLRMHGGWRVEPAGRPILGKPWLVLRGAEWQAVQRRGPVLELGRGRADRLGPAHLAPPPPLGALLFRVRANAHRPALGAARPAPTRAAGVGKQ